MNGHSGAMSPVSVDGSDWSGINQYQKSDPPFSPTFSSRGALATPPTSGIPSAPMSPSLPVSPSGMVPSQPSSGNPSPPNSVAARSSVGTLGGDERDGGRRRRQMEEILGQHYTALKRFLNAASRNDANNGRSNKAKARDKLLRLSPTQFHELSTDVYDELVRRQQANPPPGRPPRPDVPTFLPPRTDFHEKRNQARQKLSSLAHGRFRDLATDVYCELERRFPQFTGRRPPNMPPDGRRSQSRGPPRSRGYPSGPPGSPFPPRQGSLGGPPSMNGDGPFPRSFQSNTMVPNKSTMVEDSDDMGMDDDDDARSDAFALDAVLSRRGTTTTIGESKLLLDSQAQVSALQEKVDNLEELIRAKDEELARSQDSDQSAVSSNERQEWDDLRFDLESKVTKAEDLNSSLQLELDRVRADHDTVERDLRSQIDEAGRSGGSDEALAAQYADLESRHQSLQVELQQQQQLTEDVRRETSEFLMEMKTLTAQSHSNWEREEQLSNDVHRLETEVNDWKHRYAKAKSQLRHLRTSSGGFEDRPDASIIAKEHELVQADGVVKDIHVTKFQMSIDELLRVARFEDSRGVLGQVTHVVMAVRYIVNDVGQAPPPMDGSEMLRTKATARVSATANNMITAARNFATSSGLSPVSLLDAAASHLSTAVVELVRVVKIQASPADELDDIDVDMSTEKFPDYFSPTASQRRYSNHSEYSILSPPDQDHPAMQNAYGGYDYGLPQEDHDHDLQELKLYVEDQTDSMVQSIQALVAGIRSEQGLHAIESHASAISDVVGRVVSATENLIHDRSGDIALRETSEPFVQTLDECRGRLMNTVAEGHNAASPEALREVTNQLPPIAFEIARQNKELVQRLEGLSLGDEDDFR